jgi:hypothetical protein
VGGGAGVGGRRPRHPVGWLLLGVGLAVALSVLVEWYAKYGLVVRPGSLPGAEYLPGFAVLGFIVIALACAGFVLLLTPTGKLPSPRWRWWCGSAAPARSSACSCAGWPCRRPWPRGCCWSPWSPAT